MLFGLFSWGLLMASIKSSIDNHNKINQYEFIYLFIYLFIYSYLFFNVRLMHILDINLHCITVGFAFIFLEVLYLRRISLFWRKFLWSMVVSSCLLLWMMSMNGFRKYWTIFASIYNPLWSDVATEQNGRIPHLVTILYIIIV